MMTPSSNGVFHRVAIKDIPSFSRQPASGCGKNETLSGKKMAKALLSARSCRMDTAGRRVGVDRCALWPL
ncbi:conserved hypothetical protein [Mesorhizobium ventifaucium]|uniref:Propionyl-coenzyme A carboxylase alpha polypeptide n=1 Tax=Mesorhizobium ventifaucium TaxID=666020 RepID=A0ABM9DMG8_9HYPH|nr:conserved hypothetical protein [Mesorhizobium ventifaucium]